MVDKLNDVELYQRIRPLLKEVIPKGALPDNISSETRLLEDLDVDSARVVDLVLTLEDTFSISIEDAIIDTLKTAGDVVALLKEKIA
jgi:acyl carrier protein